MADATKQSPVLKAIFRTAQRPSQCYCYCNCRVDIQGESQWAIWIYCISSFLSICGERSHAASSWAAKGPSWLYIVVQLLHHHVVEDVRGIMPRVPLVLLK